MESKQEPSIIVFWKAIFPPVVNYRSFSGESSNGVFTCVGSCKGRSDNTFFNGDSSSSGIGST